MTKYNIVVYSDTVCPWCYIGYKRLYKGISMFQKTYPGASSDEFSLTWKPYFLDRDPPKESVPYMERMLKKFGPERVAANKARLAHIGQMEDINFAFDGRIGDTKPSHSLMHLAGSKGESTLQNKVAESLFQAHFEEARDITKVDTLVEVAERAGMDGAEVRGYLNDDKNLKAVIEEAQEGTRKEHINGVPHFIINDKMVVGGAQGESEWMQVFGELKEDED